MSVINGPLAALRRSISRANWRAIGAALALCLFVAFLQVLFLYPLHKTADLPIWDEAIYMGNGNAFLHGGSLGTLSDSPLYALLYSALVAEYGRIGSIFCAKYLVKTFVSLAFFWFLSAHLRSRLLALLLTMVWIVGQVNLIMVVLVNLAALGLFLLALICIEKRQVLALLLLCLSALTRLEFLLPFIAFAGFLAWTSVKAIAGKRASARSDGEALFTSRWEYGAAIFLVLLIGFVAIHVRDFNPGSKRAWFAFNADYAYTQAANGRFNLDDPSIDYNIVMQADFPGANSLPQALAVNPRRFVGYISGNVPKLANSVLSTVAISYSGSMLANSLAPPQRTHPMKIMYRVVAVTFVIAVLLASFKKEFFRNVAAAFREKKLLFYATVMSIPALLPALIAIPEPRYALITAPFLFFWPGLVWREAFRAIDPQRSGRRVLLVLCGLFLFMMMIAPKPYSGTDFSRPILDEISTLSQLWPHQRLKLMGITSTWYADYLGPDRATPIEPFGTSVGNMMYGEAMQGRAGDMAALIRQYNPDVVLVNGALVASPNFHVQTLSVLDSSAWRRCTIEGDRFYFKAGEVDTRFPCFAK
jgi:hypothetical protein